MLLVMVTYTHNDADLLNGLLREVARWSVKPSHIFVIDDHSALAYVLPLELKTSFGGSAALSAQMVQPEGGMPDANLPNLPGLDVVRPAAHLGPAQAKSFGLDLAFDAGADVVLSIDCDVRLGKHWLNEALNIASQPGVGLVGSDLRHGLAGDVLSGYLRAFELVPRSIVATQFLGAGVWVLRKDVWRASGGLTEHEQYTHEDLYFSKRLKDMNFELIAHNDPPGTQVRRLRRSAYFNRELRYLGFAILGVSKSKGINQALALILERSAGRLEQAKKLNQPSFFYIELLWISALLLYLAARGALPGQPKCACDAVAAEVKNLLSGYPNICQLLQTDLEAMHLVQGNFCIPSFGAYSSDLPGLPGLPGPVPQAAPAKWEDSALETSELGNLANSSEEQHLLVSLIKAIFDLWKKHPACLQSLEREEIALIRQADANFDFSLHYLEGTNI